MCMSTNTHNQLLACAREIKFSPTEPTPVRLRWVTYLHAALGQSAMKAFPFVINCSLSEEQSLGESNILTPHYNNSVCKTNEWGGNCRQTKITFPIKVLVSLGSQKPPALLNCLTALIYPLISLPVEKPPERGYESTNRAHLMWTGWGFSGWSVLGN